MGTLLMMRFMRFVEEYKYVSVSLPVLDARGVYRSLEFKHPEKIVPALREWREHIKDITMKGYRKHWSLTLTFSFRHPLGSV